MYALHFKQNMIAFSYFCFITLGKKQNYTADRNTLNSCQGKNVVSCLFPTNNISLNVHNNKIKSS